MSGPTRFRAPLPTTTRLPRVGRLRLGEKTSSGRPKAVEFFRVEEDESGITSPESAAAFHSTYGEEPKSVRIQIAGHTIDDVLDMAFRFYGKGGLKRRCEGPGGRCSERTATGDWDDGPCACEARNDHYCELSWSFQFLLPDVSGVGVWDLSSGSEMSRDAIVGFLQMMLVLRGSIALLECDMRVVMKTGRAGSLVPTVELRAHDATPRQMLEAQPGHVDLPELPPPALDDAPEPTIHKAGFTDSPAADAPDGAQADPTSAAGEAPTTGPFTPGHRDDQVDEAEILRENVSLQIKFLAPPLKTRLKAICEHYGARPTRDGLIEAWGTRAQDLENLVDKLESDMNAEAQQTLEGEVVDA